MLKADVRIGGTYVAKVSGRLTKVRLDSECRYGGWNATNMVSGRTIHIKSAAKLRRELSAPLSTERPSVRGTEVVDV